jgi:hypothetical protein
VDGELYCRTADYLLLPCLDSDKLKWLQVKFIKELRRAGFYWTNMIANYFGYYKGCDECQRFGNIQLAPTVMMQQIIKPLPFR